MTAATLAGEFTDIENQKFGRLTAVKRHSLLKANRKTMSLWECVCDCGTVVCVRLNNLTSGNTKSCGCLHLEAMAKRRGLKAAHYAEYVVWCGMRYRCTQPKNSSYADYGGRGIKVCDRWLNSFEDFLSDVGPRPSPDLQLDRIDNDGNYEPGNVQWATPAVQSRNRRNNVNITIDGKTQCLTDWARERGLPADMVQMRIQRLGWSPITAVMTPKLRSKYDRIAA